jgi:hypothetical protein
LQLFIHAIAVNPLPRLILLGGGDRNRGGIQARTASPIDKMAELEKSIHKALTKLTSQLESIEKKVDRNSADLGTVREKVNLAMTSISLVQEEQAHVARQLKSTSPESGVPGVLESLVQHPLWRRLLRSICDLCYPQS